MSPLRALNDTPLIRDLCDRGRDRGAYERWMAQVEATGFCECPIRLAGRISERDRGSGEVRIVYESDGEPDAVTYLACGSRLASKCVPCSSRYWRDAFQLVAAGLRGGKGVPESVRTHPTLFVTFTAPGFGHVHSRRLTPNGKPRTCRPRERGDEATCSHGRPTGCYRRHSPDDDLLGQPICPECFDYEAAVLWNTLSTQLWKRTPTRIRRELARLAGLKVKELESFVRLEYVKVAETQRRGLIHFHALIRLDHAVCESDGLGPPGEWLTIELLEQAVRATVRSLKVHGCRRDGQRIGVRWGHQIDVQRVATRLDSALTVEMAAGYLAKYATKEPSCWLDFPTASTTRPRSA